MGRQGAGAAPARSSRTPSSPAHNPTASIAEPPSPPALTQQVERLAVKHLAVHRVLVDLMGGMVTMI